MSRYGLLAWLLGSILSCCYFGDWFGGGVRGGEGREGRGGGYDEGVGLW